jgi:hypothetical protein
MSVGGKWITSAARILAGLLVLAGMFAVWHRLRSLDPPETPPLERVGEAALATAEMECPGARHARLRLVVSRLTPQERSLEADAVLCVPERMLRGLSDGERPIWRLTPKGLLLRDGFKAMALTVHLDASLPAQGATLKVALEELFQSEDPEFAVVSSAITIPLAGQPDSYPLDWYALAGRLSLELPPELQYVDERDGTGTVATELPASLSVLSGAGLGDYSVETRRLTDRPDYHPRFRLQLETEPDSRLFVAALLAVPVLFVAMSFTVLRAPGADARAFIVAFLSAALALLPIREVLVPESLEGLTLVDWCLGAEILGLFGAAVWLLPRALR